MVCELLPPNDIYACFAISHYQNKDRVCTAEQYWATGSVYAQRYVAKVVDQKLVPVASCSYNGNDDNCPGGISDEARWNTAPRYARRWAIRPSRCPGSMARSMTATTTTGSRLA